MEMNTAKNTSDIKGLILDFGGTIDTNGQHWGKMLWRSYQQEGMPVTEDAFREAYVHGERTLGNNPLIRADYSLKKTIDVKLRLELEQLCILGAWEADEKELKRMREQLTNRVYEHVSAIIHRNKMVLEKLHLRHPFVMVTNFYGNMRQVLKEFELDDLFEDVIESAVVNIRKPDARLFKMALDVLQMPAANVLAVGDSYYKDIEPASAIGCQTAWLKGEGWTDKPVSYTHLTLPTSDLV